MNTVPVGFSKNREWKNGVKLSSWIKKEDQQPEQIYGVFNGGGAKGAAFSGAIEAFDGFFDWKAVAGTSAGAITAAFVAAGYNGAAIKEIVKELDLSSLMDIPELKDVQELPRRWINASKVDIMTQVLSDIDHSMLCSPSEYQFKNSHKSIFSKRPYSNKTIFPLKLSWWVNRFSGTISNKVLNALSEVFSLDDRSKKKLEQDMHRLLFFKNNWSLKKLSGQERRTSLRHIMLTILEKKLPNFVFDKIQHEGDDKLLALFLGLYYKGGAFSGKVFIEKMEYYLQMALREEIDLDSPVTFAELPIDLHVIASDISNNRLVNFPNDLVNYGYQDVDPTAENYHKDFSVSQAIRASMSIPLVYQPYILKNPVTDEEFQLVDGGMLSNFPVASFNHHDNNVPVCGFWLGADFPESAKYQRVFPFVTAHINTMMEAHDNMMMNVLHDKIFITKISLEITPIEDEMLSKGRMNTKRKKARAKRYLKNLEGFRLDLKNKIDSSNSVDIEQLNKHILTTDISINELNNELEGYKKLTLVRNCNTLDFDLTESQKNELHCNGQAAAKKEVVKVKAYLKKVTETNTVN